jgi:lysozyme family protein
MPAQFASAFDYLMRWEDDPNDSGKVTVDPGGRTRYGIAEKYWGTVLPSDFYTTMSANDARTFASGFYRNNFWEPLHLDSVQHQFLADYILSLAVNLGITQVVRWIQLTLDLVEDGILGPETLAAINAAPAQAIGGLFTQAYHFYQTEPTVYLLGLKRRAKG